MKRLVYVKHRYLSLYMFHVLMQSLFSVLYMNCNVSNRTFSHVRPAKIQISMRIRAVWSESLLCAFWIAKDAKFLYANNEETLRPWLSKINALDPYGTLDVLISGVILPVYSGKSYLDCFPSS